MVRGQWLAPAHLRGLGGGDPSPRPRPGRVLRAPDATARIAAEVGLTSEEAAAGLAEIAYPLRHDPEQSFRARAYGNAAATLNRLKPDLVTLRAEGRLESIQGIGSGIAKV